MSLLVGSRRARRSGRHRLEHSGGAFDPPPVPVELGCTEPFQHGRCAARTRRRRGCRGSFGGLRRRSWSGFTRIPSAIRSGVTSVRLEEASYCPRWRGHPGVDSSAEVRYWSATSSCPSGPQRLSPGNAVTPSAGPPPAPPVLPRQRRQAMCVPFCSVDVAGPSVQRIFTRRRATTAGTGEGVFTIPPVRARWLRWVCLGPRAVGWSGPALPARAR